LRPQANTASHPQLSAKYVNTFWRNLFGQGVPLTHRQQIHARLRSRGAIGERAQPANHAVEII